MYMYKKMDGPHVDMTFKLYGSLNKAYINGYKEITVEHVHISHLGTDLLN